MKILFAILATCSLMLLSCGNDPKPDSKMPVADAPKTAAARLAADFNADSAYTYIEKQLSFGTRITGTPTHKKCGEWIVNKFKSFGAEVMVQPATVTASTGEKLQMQNIIASVNPTAKKRIMISAHWDSRPWADNDSLPEYHTKPIMAANDAGSGVAVALEMARLFQTKNPNVGVDFILWDAEDWGKSEAENSFCLGSQYWAKNKHKKDYRAEYGINLDMVGAKGATFYQDKLSLKQAASETENIWRIANELGYGNYFYFEPIGDELIDDYKYAIEGGVKMVEIIDRRLQVYEGRNYFPFFPYWHTHKDNIDCIDRNTLKAIGQTLMEVVMREKGEVQ